MTLVCGLVRPLLFIKHVHGLGSTRAVQIETGLLTALRSCVDVEEHKMSPALSYGDTLCIGLQPLVHGALGLFLMD